MGQTNISMQSVDISQATLQTAVPQTLAVFHRNQGALQQWRMALQVLMSSGTTKALLSKRFMLHGPPFNNDLLSKRSMLATALVNDLALNFAPGHTIQQEIFDDAKFHGNASDTQDKFSKFSFSENKCKILGLQVDAHAHSYTVMGYY